MAYTRLQAATLARRLAEPRRFIQAVAGPRQVGKTTLVQQVIDTSGRVARFASADEPTLRGPGWIAQQWDAARLAAADVGKSGAVLVLEASAQFAQRGRTGSGRQCAKFAHCRIRQTGPVDHPFSDGNKRIGSYLMVRLIINLLMERSG